jgi:hypothetical protein
MPVFTYVATLGEVVAIAAKVMLLVLRSSENPFSLLELSVQARLTLLVVVAVTVRLDGAVGPG